MKYCTIIIWVTICLIGCKEDKYIRSVPITKEDYEVYSAVIDSIARLHPQKYVIVYEHTVESKRLSNPFDTTFYATHVNDSIYKVFCKSVGIRYTPPPPKVYSSDMYLFLQNIYPSDDWSVISTNFRRANIFSTKLDSSNFHLSIPVYVLCKSDLEGILHRDTSSMIAHEINPYIQKGYGYSVSLLWLEFTRVGFDAQRKTAIVYLGNNSSYGDKYFILKKYGSRWSILKVLQ